MDVYIRPMTYADIPSVLQLEAEAFPQDPPTDLNKELGNRLASYLVACCTEQNGLISEELIIGYCGAWLVIDEAHLLSIAVKEDYRGRGIGELLLISALEDVIGRGAQTMFLEVRMSNTPARALYEKYGFARLGIRRGYYQDNNEDAVVMAADDINDLSFKNNLVLKKNQIIDKLRLKL